MTAGEAAQRLLAALNKRGLTLVNQRAERDLTTGEAEAEIRKAFAGDPGFCALFGIAYLIDMHPATETTPPPNGGPVHAFAAKLARLCENNPAHLMTGDRLAMLIREAAK